MVPVARLITRQAQEAMTLQDWSPGRAHASVARPALVDLLAFRTLACAV
jgi:hypothetical protein